MTRSRARVPMKGPRGFWCSFILDSNSLFSDMKSRHAGAELKNPRWKLGCPEEEW